MISLFARFVSFIHHHESDDDNNNNGDDGDNDNNDDHAALIIPLFPSSPIIICLCFLYN